MTIAFGAPMTSAAARMPSREATGSSQPAATRNVPQEMTGSAEKVPPSRFASPQARAAWEARDEPQKMFEAWVATLTGPRKALPTKDLRIIWFREQGEAAVWKPLLTKQTARYAVDIRPATIGGIGTEVFVPTDGVAPGNAKRVLINLHGGAFYTGADYLSRIESIPIASVGRIKVVSVNYRMAPDDRFPAASEDVIAVYRALLKDYRPDQIGIYGCSAGATLTAQAVAMIVQEKLPLPGAVGMFCGTGEVWAWGDSAYYWAFLNGKPLASAEQDPRNLEYLKGIESNNPLIYPMRFPGLVARFPPALLITGTRAFEMSSVVDAHNKLVAAGVRSELRVWDGVMHGFLYDPDLPESQQAYDAIAGFFEKNLGRGWFAPEIEAFLAADLANPPEPCGTVFVGSSSIRRWHSLDADFAPLPVLNRGFGGSTIADVNKNFDRVVTPYRPRAIIFYAGENDLALGDTPSQVVDDFARFLDLKTRLLGKTPVYFISLKPSRLRAAQRDRQAEVNAAVRRLASSRNDLIFIDVVPAMIEAEASSDLFEPDGLHMAKQGYVIWTRLVRAALAVPRSLPAYCRGDKSAAAGAP